MPQEAPPDIKKLLKHAAMQVLQQRDANLFLNDGRLGPVDISTDPVVSVEKTGGTTQHRQQGGDYLHYILVIPAGNIRYSIYVTRPSADPVVNRTTLARAIVWFIYHYDKGTTTLRDEPATLPNGQIAPPSAYEYYG